MNRKYGWTGPGPVNWTAPRYMMSGPVAVNHVDPMSTLPIRDQGEEGACTGFGSTGAVATVLKLSAPLSPQMAYFLARVREAAEASDSGATVADAVAGIMGYGVSAESVCPYVVGQYTQRPSLDAFADAITIKSKLQSALQVHSLNELKHALASGYPVVFGFSVPSYFEGNQINVDGWLPLPTTRDWFLGGHCVYADGFDDRVATPFVWCVNSWSDTWGLKGRFKMDQAWFTDPRGLADDMWAFIPT